MKRIVVVLLIGIMFLISCQEDTYTKEEVFFKMYGTSLNQEAIKIISLNGEGYVILASSEKDTSELGVINKAALFFVDNEGNQTSSEMYLPISNDYDFYPTDIVESQGSLFISGYSQAEDTVLMAVCQSSQNGVESGIGFRTYFIENSNAVATNVFVSDGNVMLAGYYDSSYFNTGDDEFKRTPVRFVLENNGDVGEVKNDGIGAGLFGSYSHSEGSNGEFAYLVGTEYSINGSTQGDFNIIVDIARITDAGLYDSYVSKNDGVYGVTAKAAYLNKTIDELLVAAEYDVDNTHNIKLLRLDASAGGMMLDNVISFENEYNVSPTGVTSDDQGNILVVGKSLDLDVDEEGYEIYSQFITAGGIKSDPIVFGGSEDDEAVDVINANDGGFLILGTSGFEKNKMINLIKLSPDGTFE